MVFRGVWFLFCLIGGLLTSGCALSTMQPGGGRVPLAATGIGCADPLPLWVETEPPSSNPHDYASVHSTMAPISGVSGIANSNYRCVYIQRAERNDGLSEITFTFYHYGTDGQISSPLTLTFFGEPDLGHTYPIDLTGDEHHPLVGAVAISGTVPVFATNYAAVATTGSVRFETYPGRAGGPVTMIFQSTLVPIGYNGGTPQSPMVVSSVVRTTY